MPIEEITAQHTHTPAENGKRCEACGLNYAYWERFPLCGINTDGKASERHKEEWYALEFSPKGADDWFATNEKYDSLDWAQGQWRRIRSHLSDWRIVRKTLITEVVK